ncbi:suppressor of RPS4-RLD 1 [Oryza brachyantha]|uniref:Suppressor of RPS4-RLD 1 n=1 Tax=Oryza brachyantha TaxID=4533 RepID=J3MI51_ORYBR|nr:suppressor of RPS4-RLD 1 [Oryza brachyantha]
MGSERAELARVCGARNWSKAIRILDALLAGSPSSSIHDLCNRAFCYSQLELHKHVVKDCDRALGLDPALLQAYVLKGKALLALGKREEALAVWEQGHEIAVRDTMDLKQLLELEELVSSVKISETIECEDRVVDASPCDTKVVISEDRVVDTSFTATTMADTKTVVCEENIGNSGVISNGGMMLANDNKVDSNKECSSPKTDTTETHHTPKRTPKPDKKSKAKGRKEINSQTEDVNGETVAVDQTLFASKISKSSKSISLDFRLSRGIAQVNEGRYDQAISIFDQILRETPTYPEALIGRGTAYAFQRELDSAISDFTKAIQSNPSAGEAWKRRGQARAALGEFTEAVEDLTKALEFEPNSPDILHERGIVNFKFKDYNAAFEDLSTCVKRDKKNSSAHTYLGLTLSALGEYKRAEDEHLIGIKFDENFLDSWAHLSQLYLDIGCPEKMLNCIEKVLQIDVSFGKAYHLRGILYHGMGRHRSAIKDLSVALKHESSNIECLYLRASCHHAIGEYKAAIKDYDDVLDLELDSMDKFVLQCLAFYQKEIALYIASKANLEFSQFNIDDDVDPLFKEYWCKRLHPKNVAEKVYRQPPLRISLRSGRLNKQDFKFTKHQTTLILAADSIGKKIQYNCRGFLPNQRQYRMAGLAAIEIAQKISKAWRFLRNPKNNAKLVRRRDKLNTSQNRGGYCSTSTLSGSPTSSPNEDRVSSGISLSWHDVYNIAVKWRQISEPCDPVVWINKLSEEFNSGFGSHTPMLLGQAKIIRYYPYYQRVLEAAKNIMLDLKYVNNAEDRAIFLTDIEKLKKIEVATSCSDLYYIVGETYWVSTRCDSIAFRGRRLEGTRITTQNMGKTGFDFAIRTPCTPSRWEEYDEEMTAAWEAICDAYCSDTNPTRDPDTLDAVKAAILRMTYYWYNFMPLSRGSAVVGYVVLLGLFLAATMDVTASIPQGTQVDWEAILSPDPDTFVDKIKPWLYPSIKASRNLKDYADVSAAFSTTGSVVAALTCVDT